MPKVGFRVGLITNDLLSEYEVSFLRALEWTVRNEGGAVRVWLGGNLGRAHSIEETRNGIYQWIDQESVDGVLVLSGTLTNLVGKPALVKLCSRLSTLPLVTVGLQVTRYPSVTVDNRAGMRQSVEHLIRHHGCRRVAFLGGPKDNQEAEARLQGYRYALEADGLAVQDTLVVHGQFDVQSGRDGMRELLRRGRRFSAVAAANDLLAVGAMEVLAAQPLPVPEKIKVVGFDDSPVATATGLSSVTQPVELMAARAHSMLLELQANGRATSVAFCPQLATRESCACGSYRSAEMSAPPSSRAMAPADYAKRRREALVDLTAQANPSRNRWWRAQAPELIDCLIEELGGKRRTFAKAVSRLCSQAVHDDIPSVDVSGTVVLLQRHFEGAGYRGSSQAQLNSLWNRALTTVSVNLARAERQYRERTMERMVGLTMLAQALWTVRDPAEIALLLGSLLDPVGIQRAAVAVCTGPDMQWLVPLFAIDGDRALPCEAPYPRADIVPPGLQQPCANWLISPIHSNEDILGVWICDSAVDPFVSEQVRLHLAALFERIALREQLAAVHGRDEKHVPKPTPFHNEYTSITPELVTKVSVSSKLSEPCEDS